MKLDSATYQFKDRGKFGPISLTVGIVGFAVAAVGFSTDAKHFFYAYLTAFVFWISISLGMLFFTMLNHLTQSKWSVVVRRMSESFIMPLPWMFLLAIPMLLGMHELYHWSHADVMAHDAILRQKAGYLNVPFFVIRTVVYFAIWSAIAFVLTRTSQQQDREFKREQMQRFKRVSAVGMLLFSLTLTAAAFDWLMSLEPHWYSTIYGVYFFSGGLLSAVSMLVVFASVLRGKGILAETVTEEHYHDLGKLMLGFVIFWAYIGFSQYLLDWYGNIPEETIWYLDRWVGGWQVISLIVFFGHFVFPFVVLLFREIKRRPALLRLMALWILAMHWVDMYWLAFPSYLKEGAHFGLIDVTTTLACMVGFGGVYFYVVWQYFTKHRAVPVNDPKLEASINFVNS